jgi:hypothetical protein
MFKRFLFAFITECRPLQFWIISRHGTRYVHQDDITDMWSLTDLQDQIIKNFEARRKQ